MHQPPKFFHFAPLEDSQRATIGNEDSIMTAEGNLRGAPGKDDGPRSTRSATWQATLSRHIRQRRRIFSNLRSNYVNQSKEDTSHKNRTPSTADGGGKFLVPHNQNFYDKKIDNFLSSIPLKSKSITSPSSHHHPTPKMLSPPSSFAPPSPKNTRHLNLHPLQPLHP